MRRMRREVLGDAAAASSIAAAPGSIIAGQGQASSVIIDDLSIHLRRYARNAAASTPVIYVHGATFPSSLAIGWRFGEEPSWADDLTEAGYDVWAFDFAGYGASQRYPQMAAPPAPGPLGRSVDAVRQLAGVVAEVRRMSRSNRVILLAHSWGTMVAARFAADHPSLVERLVLFGPILERQSGQAGEMDKLPGWSLVTLEDQITRFREDVPKGEPELITDRMFAPWGAAYLASDPTSCRRQAAAVAVPNGPVADVVAARAGNLAYDPARICCPVAIVRGEWDSRVTDSDVAQFEAELSACPCFSDAKLERGTHLMHLETGRGRLWTATRNALAPSKPARIDTHVVIFEVKPSGERRTQYLAAAASLRPLLDEVDGFVSIERFQSKSREGWILSLSSWADEAAIASWRSRDRHHEAQVQGRSGIFADYRLRVAHALSDNGVSTERQPIYPSSYKDPSRRRIAYIGLVEIQGERPDMLDPLLRPQFATGDAEMFSSLSKPGKSVHLVDLESFTSAQVWRTRIEEANLVGTDSSLRVRVLEVLRDYGMFDRAEAPQYHLPLARRAGVRER